MAHANAMSLDGEQFAVIMGWIGISRKVVQKFRDNRGADFRMIVQLQSDDSR